MKFLHFIYRTFTSASIPVLCLLAILGNKKLRALFAIRTPDHLPPPPPPSTKYAWFHCASLGEYEQAHPVIEAYIASNPTTPILLTFFSPSGLLPLKSSPPSWLRPQDFITSLPLDTPRKVRTFLSSLEYRVKFFASCKYEVWPELLYTLSSVPTPIPTYVFAAHIPASSPLTRHTLVGRYLRWSWSNLTGILTQSSSTTNILAQYKIDSIPMGDPRVDRVISLATSLTPPAPILSWARGAHITVAGSSWYSEEIALATLPWSATKKLIVAPHDISLDHISEILTRFNSTSSTLSASTLSNFNPSAPILIIDSMGILTSIYPLADLAVVGGGFKDGIHNVLEPAVHGIPVITGPNIGRFREALKLKEEGVLTVVNESNQLASIVWKAIDSEPVKSTWLTSQKGCAIKIVSYLP